MYNFSQPSTALYNPAKYCKTVCHLVNPCTNLYNLIQPCTYKHIDPTRLFIVQILHEYRPNIVQRLLKYCLHIVKILLTFSAFYSIEILFELAQIAWLQVCSHGITQSCYQIPAYDSWKQKRTLGWDEQSVDDIH